MRNGNMFNLHEFDEDNVFRPTGKIDFPKMVIIAIDRFRSADTWTQAKGRLRIARDLFGICEDLDYCHPRLPELRAKLNGCEVELDLRIREQS